MTDEELAAVLALVAVNGLVESSGQETVTEEEWVAAADPDSGDEESARTRNTIVTAVGVPVVAKLRELGLLRDADPATDDIATEELAARRLHARYHYQQPWVSAPLDVRETFMNDAQLVMLTLRERGWTPPLARIKGVYGIRRDPVRLPPVCQIPDCGCNGEAHP